MNVLFGPMVRWELVRLARSGRVARVRVLLLYALLLGVVGFAVVTSYMSLHKDPFHLLLERLDPLSTRTPAEWGGQLAFVLLEVQLLFVAAVAPAYAAAAVSEERDRRTLPLVLATQITDREIVWGKAAARAVFLLAAVAAGAPVLMLTLLFGGVDPGMIVAGYALTAGTIVLSVGIGMNAACHAPDGRTALVRAYGLAAVLVGGALVPPFVLFSPFAMLAYYQEGLSSDATRTAVALGYPVAQVVVACRLLAEATRGLRRAGPTDGPPKPTAYPEPPRGRAVPLLTAPPDADYPPLPPVDDADPVLWKERHAGRAPLLPALDQPVRLLGGVATIAAITLFVTGGYLLAERVSRALDPREAGRLSSGPEPPDAAGPLLVTAGVLASALYLLPLAVGVTGCVAGERFRGTLDALLASPLDRRRLLASKVRAHLERGLAFAAGAAVGLGAGFAADGGLRLGLAALAAFAGGVALVVALGAFVSARCATPLLAFRMCSPAVVVVVGLPVLVRNTIDWDDLTTPVRVLAWGAAAAAAVAAVLWWRAGVAVDRGAE